MASLLNNASLLLNPAGSIISYQEDKIYSVLPKDGTGDFTFSGGDGGTRVNQDGYIEQTPANLLRSSEEFNNTGVWSLSPAGTGVNPVVTANATTAPNGTLTADEVIFNSGAGTSSGDQSTLFQILSNQPAGVYTATIYAKVASGTAKIILRHAGGIFYTTLNLTTEWQRFEITETLATAGALYYEVGIRRGLPNEPLTSPVTCYLWGAMLNIGSTAKPYQPTTDRLNYPRITYQNGRGALMGELQRTNQLLYSNKFDESVWAKTGLSVTSSAATSPDSTNNAWKLVPSTTSGGQYILQNSSVTSGTKYVQTIFAKAGEYQWLQFAPSTGFASTYVNFNLANGTIGNNNTGFIATIIPFRDGWYRCSLAHTATSTGAGSRIVIAPVQSDSQGRLPSWAGDGTSGIYIYGAQLETGTFTLNRPTSYIPTTTATVTRPSDIPYVSGVSSLVGQSSGGTLYVSGVPKASEQEFAAITPGGYTTVDGVFLYYTSGNNLRLYVVGGSTVQVGGNSATINVGQYFKAAVRYGNGSTAYYVNGQQIVTTAAALAFTNTLNRIDLRGNAYYYSTPGAQEISTVATYTTGLTNAQLQELTTIRSGSGGNISYYGPYTIHTFTGSATFTPSFNGEVEVLVVAGGGGGGGWYYAGGGGAGGVLYASSFGVSQGTGITVTVGAGGAQQTGNAQPGNDGSTSSFGGLSAVGGGGGGGGYFGGPAGRNGGSGGGGGRGSSYSGGLGISGQGNNGGNYNGWAGGGGGAGEAGATGANNANPGNGGDGLPYSITGFSTYYGGGGGGAVDANIDMPETVIPQGGLGGGGNGATYNNLNTAAGTGVTNTGGGGGGGCHAGANPTGAAGGSGIVIVRYLT